MMTLCQPDYITRYCWASLNGKISIWCTYVLCILVLGFSVLNTRTFFGPHP